MFETFRRLRLVPVARAAALCALLGGSVAIAGAEWRPLDEALASRRLELIPGSVRWIDRPHLGMRRALVLARERLQPADVYVITALTGPEDRIIRVANVSNLSRSPNADETDLVADERFAAYLTRVESRAVACTVVDTAGERADVQGNRGARVRGAITRLQQTGRVAGYDVDRFDFDAPAAHASVALRDGVVTVRLGDERVRIDARARRAVDGASHVRERPRVESASDNWVTWAVDTARAIPWIGSAPIAWAEGVAYRARHVARRARAAVQTTSQQETQAEVAEDLADVLDVRSTGSFEGAVNAWPPAALASPVPPAIAHEGEWSPVARDNDPFVQSNPGTPPAMYVTFVRTDRELDDARTYVLVWDPRQIELHVAPGSQEPMGATGETGSGVIPRDESTLTRLVGGFNGAFQGLHGEYGVYAEGALLLPPKPYAATVMALADGGTAFGSWPAEQHEIPPEVTEFRQNLTAMIDGGQYNPWHRDDWGPVLNNPADLRTARSGICMTREGFVAFFWGADLNPRGLADAMLAARCSYGVHLDMNGANTGFDFYRVERAGGLPPVGRRIQPGYEAEGTVDEVPSLAFRARRLVRGMQHQASRYIHRNPRDFFYMLLRPVLPGPALVPPVQPAIPGEGSWHVAGLSDLPFPWPIARTRVRPDPTQPERWVNLVRLDARRVALAPPDASGTLVARVVGAQGISDAGALRISMTQGSAGARWSIGTEGTGIAVSPLRAGMSVLRGACVDANGFLVMAAADRAVPDLVSRALALAGCADDGRVALTGVALLLANGQTASGEAAPAHADATFALVAREFPLARPMFTDVTPVPRSVWYPVQTRRVRYFPNPGNNVTVQVRLSGQQPQVFTLPGIGRRFVEQAYPDGGAPPEVPPGGN